MPHQASTQHHCFQEDMFYSKRVKDKLTKNLFTLEIVSYNVFFKINI